MFSFECPVESVFSFECPAESVFLSALFALWERFCCKCVGDASIRPQRGWRQQQRGRRVCPKVTVSPTASFSEEEYSLWSKASLHLHSKACKEYSLWPRASLHLHSKACKAFAHSAEVQVVLRSKENKCKSKKN